MLEVDIPTRTMQKISSDFIGREELFQILNDRYLLSSHGFQEVLISGDAGIGKSYAIQEFLKRISSRVFLLSYKFENTDNPQQDFRKLLLSEALAFWGIDVTYYGERLREVICYSCNIKDKDLAGILDYFFSKDRRSYHNQNVILSEFTKLFLLIIKNLPYQITLVLDDLQWVTPEIKKFMAELRSFKPSNVYVVGATREVIDAYNSDHFSYYKLTSHTPSELQQLISLRFPNVLFAHRLIDFLCTHTQGNALYATELLQHLIYANKLRVTRNGFDLAQAYKIPTSLVTTLSGRLSHVSNTANEVLNILVCIDQPIEFDILKNILEISEKSLEITIEDLRSQRLVKENGHRKYEFIHDLIKSAFYDLVGEKNLKIAHQKILEVFLRSDKGKEHILLANHGFAAEQWKLAYRYNLTAAKKSLELSTPINAIKYLKRCKISGEKLGLLGDKRDLRLSLLLAKAYFMLGKVREATQFISLANAFLRQGTRPNGLTQEAVSYLSHCYWNTGEFKKALKILSPYLSNGIDLASRRTLQGRLGGILSDMGDFEASNKIALLAIGEMQAEQKTASSDLIFPAETVLSGIIARNFAYLQDHENFGAYAEKTLHLIENEHSASIIFPLCFLADAYALNNNNALAQSLLLRAADCAKKFQFTVLNVFIFSLLGYIEVQQGNHFSLRKIQQAIDSAEDESRYGRLPLYYLYLLKAKIEVKDRSDFKRNANRALKLSRQNGEGWVEKEIQRLMADYC